MDLGIDKHDFHVAVLQGGFEPEREASLYNGGNVAQHLADAGYERVTRVDVTPYDIITKLQAERFGFAFIAMYCKWGEDGVLPGMLETLGLPYSGSGVAASAVCKDKNLFGLTAAGLGIAVPNTRIFHSVEEFKDSGGDVALPCVVKPPNNGYSIAVSYVDTPEALTPAVEKAFQVGNRAMVQDYIHGRELTIGIVDVPQAGPKVLPIVELKLKRPIQSEEVKDGHGLVDEEVPAQLTAEETADLGRQALRLYNAIGCVGVSRFDVRMSAADGTFFFLENNTCPGLHPTESDLPKQLKAAGITMAEYVDYMIHAGLHRRQPKYDIYVP